MSEHVAILLCTYNGERFLQKQLDSIAAQTHKNWHVWASDDGSHDASLTILQATQQRWGSRLTIIDGPKLGSTANFLSLIKNQNIKAHFFAYADQDDIWEAHRLSRGLETLNKALATANTAQAALYGSRTLYIDGNDSVIGAANVFTRPPAFGNALVQCIAGGNTMLFNDTLRDLIAQIPGKQPQRLNHDWLSYLVATASQGIVIYDPKPTVRYRQHGQNLIGQNQGLAARLTRLKQLLNGQHQLLIHAHLEALLSLNKQLHPDIRRQLQTFILATKHGQPTSNPVSRLAAWYRSGAYRQSASESAAFALAAFLGRL